MFNRVARLTKSRGSTGRRLCEAGDRPPIEVSQQRLHRTWLGVEYDRCLGVRQFFRPHFLVDKFHERVPRLEPFHFERIRLLGRFVLFLTNPCFPAGLAFGPKFVMDSGCQISHSIQAIDNDRLADCPASGNGFHRPSGFIDAPRAEISHVRMEQVVWKQEFCRNVIAKLFHCSRVCRGTICGYATAHTGLAEEDTSQFSDQCECMRRLVPVGIDDDERSGMIGNRVPSEIIGLDSGVA